MRWSSPLRPETRGHTLVEIVVVLVIVFIILMMMVEVVSHMERVWKTASDDPFLEAETAFEKITRNLSEATLEPYSDYVDASGVFRTSDSATFVPDHLARRSDLAFVCGPAAGSEGLLISSGRIGSGCAVFFTLAQGYSSADPSDGRSHLLNGTGYFAEYGDDSGIPSFLPLSYHRYRWRLKEIWEPSEALQIYALGTSSDWIKELLAGGASVSAVADNIITLIVRPERLASDTGTPLSADFRYDTRDGTKPLTHHQLPPRLLVAMVAIDEASAKLLEARNGGNAPALVSADPAEVDLVALDQSLTAQKIGHRIFQREITVRAAAWTEATSP